MASSGSSGEEQQQWYIFNDFRQVNNDTSYGIYLLLQLKS